MRTETDEITSAISTIASGLLAGRHTKPASASKLAADIYEEIFDEVRRRQKLELLRPTRRNARTTGLAGGEQFR